MSDNVDSLVLERLRELRAVLGDVREDTADTRLRVGTLEAGYASISLRLDRLAGDVERIKGASRFGGGGPAERIEAQPPLSAVASCGIGGWR